MTILAFFLHKKNQKNPRVRKIFVRNCGAGNDVPILWVPGKIAFFLQENLLAHKSPRFREGGILGLGGGSADFIFMGARIFRKTRTSEKQKTRSSLSEK